MRKDIPQTDNKVHRAGRELQLEMQHLQAIEGSPLTPDEIAMFEMFDSRRLRLGRPS
jgi:hypothetical protein